MEVTSDRPVAVVGGYGAVGRVVVSTLARGSAVPVTIAGRDLRRAQQLAGIRPETLTPQRFDVGDAADVDRLLDKASVVVMCVEHRNTELARACIERGVAFVDISASLDIVDGIEQLDARARRNGTAAVLSVGLAPGVTNVLARHCVDRLPSATSVDIAILLGLSGDHGPDSVRWTMEKLTAPPPAARRARVRLPGAGTRTVHPFPFSDQHTLTRTLGIPVTTRVCFDSPAVSAVLFGLRTARFFRLAARLGGTGLLTALSSRLRLGSDRFVVQAIATDAHGARVSSAVSGRRECQATGVVAAQIATLLVQGRVAPGVHHIDQVVPAEPFLEGLARYDLTLHSEGTVHHG